MTTNPCGRANVTHSHKHRSLANATDLIFAKFSGEVTDRDEYSVIKTRCNPGYHWGNYIILNSVPSDDEFDRCVGWFADEFSWIQNINHAVFSWDADLPPNNWQRFKDEGYQLEKSKVLYSENLTEPPKINHEVEIRIIETDQDWEEVTVLQALANDKFDEKSFLKFKRSQMNRILSPKHVYRSL